MRGKLKEAVREFDRAVQLNPGNASFHCNFGYANFLLGKVEEAEAAERQAIRLDSKLASAHYHLGCALAAQGKINQSADAFRHVIDLKPRWNLIYEVREDIKNKQSLANAEQALAIAKQQPKALPASAPGPIGRADG